MATSPAKPVRNARAQSPGPAISVQASEKKVKEPALNNGPVINVDSSQTSAAKAWKQRQVLARILGVVGLALIFSLEWAVYCQHRAVGLFEQAMSIPHDPHQTCRWSNEKNEFECDVGANTRPDGKTWIAPRSALCFGAHFNRVSSTSADSHKKSKEAFNLDGIHTLELLKQKLGYDLINMRTMVMYLGCFAMALGIFLVLPSGDSPMGLAVNIFWSCFLSWLIFNAILLAFKYGGDCVVHGGCDVTNSSEA